MLPARPSSAFRWLLALAGGFVVLKTLQVFLYPHPYLIGDTEQYVLSADSWRANPYKPMGYSLYLALTRWFSPSPTVSVVLQAVLRGVAALGLAWVVASRANVRAGLAVLLGALVLFDPQAWYLDHFLLADTVHLALTLAFLAALVAYRYGPGNGAFALAVAMAASAVVFRFVGVVYAALLVAVVALTPAPTRAKWARAAVVLGVVSATVVGMSAHMHWSLGRFRPTTFDGWAFFGNVGPLLDFGEWRPDSVDDPEARLVAEYLASFPAETYPSSDSSWHRWNKDAPSKHLLRAFWPRYEMDDADVRRNTAFMTGFLELAETPSTPAQRHFDAHRNRTDPSLPPFALQYWHAFIVMNDLFRGFVRAWLPDHVPEYVTGFFLPSVRRVFLPHPDPIAHGTYTFREHPDGSIPRFWPGHHTPTWRPRFGDPMAPLRHAFAPWVSAAWGIAFVAVGFAVRRASRARAFDAAALVAFAVLYGAAVAYSHLVELRYVAPILPFVWTGAVLAADGIAQGNRA